MPLLSMTVHNKDPSFVADLTRLQAYVEEDNPDQISYAATLNFKALGAKLGKSMKVVAEAAKNLTAEDFASFEANGESTMAGFQITNEEMTLTRSMKGLTDPNLDSHMNSESIVVLDF